MNTFNHFSRTFTREDDTCVWLAFNERRLTWSAEIIVRVPGGIRYRELDYGNRCPAMQQMRRDALLGGFFSQRPMRLGGPVDPSMRDCVLALFGNFCASQRLDAAALLKKQVPSYRGGEDFYRIRKQAAWEGIIYPARWTLTQADALATALDGICCDYLAEVIAKKVQGDE